MADNVDSITDGSDASEAARTLGKLGASKGGIARRESLTPEQRSEIARKAVKTRWENARTQHVPKAIIGSPDHPLRIAGFEIPCYVLDDERRVLVQRGMMTALDMAQGTAGRGEGDRLAKFIATKSVGPYVTEDLATKITSPILFSSQGGALAYGYEATVLADLCDVVLKGRREGKLNYQQDHIAERCEILMSGFARIGIVALVDEATGYQYIRARKALEEILDEFIAKELVAWARKFPDEFYEHLFRLKGWKPSPGSSRRPKLFARLTVDLVYDRLAPGVLEELRRLSPRNDRGRRKNALHQWLSEDVGIPKLRDHFIALNSIMRGHEKWEAFYAMVNRSLPKYNTTGMLPLNFDDDQEE